MNLPRVYTCSPSWTPPPTSLPVSPLASPGLMQDTGCLGMVHWYDSMKLLNHPKPVHPKGDQSWVFIGWTDVEAETPILWPPDMKSWRIGKNPDAGKDWGQEEKGMTEDEMVGWHHRLNGHGFRWTLGVGDGQGGLACCNSWGHKKLDVTEPLNWTELNLKLYGEKTHLQMTHFGVLSI